MLNQKKKKFYIVIMSILLLLQDYFISLDGKNKKKSLKKEAKNG